MMDTDASTYAMEAEFVQKEVYGNPSEVATIRFWSWTLYHTNQNYLAIKNGYLDIVYAIHPPHPFIDGTLI